MGRGDNDWLWSQGWKEASEALVPMGSHPLGSGVTCETGGAWPGLFLF